METIKGTVERSEKKQTSKGKDIWTVKVGNNSYQCWSELKEGETLPDGATVKPAPEGTTFLPTIVLPKSGGSYGGGSKKSDPYYSKTTAWDTCCMQAVELTKLASMSTGASEETMVKKWELFHDRMWKKYTEQVQ